MTQANWSDDRVEQLKSLWTEGLSASQIARALGGVTRNAVIGKVHRLGLAGRASPSRSERPRMPMAPKAPSAGKPMPAPPAPAGAEARSNSRFAEVQNLGAMLQQRAMRLRRASSTWWG